MNTLVGLIEGLWLRGGPYVRLTMLDRDSMLSSMADHWNMVEVIKRRDARAASEAIRDYICRSAVNLLEALPRR